MTGKVRGRIRVFGPISVRRKAFLSQSLTKLSLEVVVSNLISSVGLLKIDTLRTAQDGGGGSLPSGVTEQLSI
jgi:hypothetical protein